MEQILQSLEKFIASPICVFDFKTIDYPTEFQQHLITNYFEMNNLLKTYAHNDVIRQLHTSERSMQTFIAGLLYQMILQPTSVHFQTYMPSLRTESWMYFSKLMQQLLTDSFLWLKEDFRWGVIALLQKLCYYRHLQADHIILAVKTMDYLDLSESSMNYNNQMLHLFYQILTESAQTSITSILAKTLFFKLLRMMSVLLCFEDQPVREYKMRCVAVMQKLFQVQKERCLVVGNSGINVIKEVESEEMLHTLLPQLKQALQKAEVRPESAKSASLRLSCILPMRVQSTLLFVIHQNLTKIELKLQLDWVFNAGSQQNILLVIDILRYVLALSTEELPIKECIFILEWLFYRVCSNNVLFEVWKDELFYPCFAEPCPFPAAPERAFHFLAYLLDTDVDFGQNLLVFLLRNVQISKKADLLKSMLTRANELKIINLTTLINHPRLRSRTKEELLVVLGHKKNNNHTPEAPQNQQQTVYYDPFSFVRKDSQISLDFSEESHESQQYANSSEELEIVEEEQQKEKKGRVKLQKIFVQDMGESLTELLEKPSLPIYIEFYKELLTITKNFRMSEEHSMIETFVSETAKTTYLLFQNQFQSHSQLVPKEHNIIFHLLNTVALEWRTNSYNLQLTKKIIKRICEYFPTAELAIWRIFLIHFRRGVVLVGREMREWLITKEKGQYALSLLRELGSLTKQIIQNAQYMKLPY